MVILVLLSPAGLRADSAKPALSQPLRVATFNLFHGGVLSGLTGDTQDLDRRLEMAVVELRQYYIDINYLFVTLGRDTLEHV